MNANKRKLIEREKINKSELRAENATMCGPWLREHERCTFRHVYVSEGFVCEFEMEENMRHAKSNKAPWKLWTNSESSRLCGAHFEDDCFIPPSPNLAKSIGFVARSYNLKKGAIPTFLGGSASIP